MRCGGCGQLDDREEQCKPPKEMSMPSCELQRTYTFVLSASCMHDAAPSLPGITTSASVPTCPRARHVIFGLGRQA